MLAMPINGLQQVAVTTPDDIITVYDAVMACNGMGGMTNKRELIT